MSKKPEVIVLYETALQSWLRDASSVAMFVALIGIGVLLDSSAMQWIGAIIGFLAIFTRASGASRKCRMTLDQARKRIDEIEAGMAGGK